MGRLMTMMGVVALVVAACAAGSTPSVSPTPAPSPSPSPAVITPSPEASPSPSVAAIPAAVTFDGTKCTYAGPSVVPLGAHMKFSLTNTPAAMKGSRGAALLVGPVLPSVTWDEIVAYQKTHTATQEPDWIQMPNGVGDKDFDVMFPEEANNGYTLDVPITHPNRYLAMCATAPEETNQAFAAALVAVMND